MLSSVCVCACACQPGTVLAPESLGRPCCSLFGCWCCWLVLFPALAVLSVCLVCVLVLLCSVLSVVVFAFLSVGFCCCCCSVVVVGRLGCTAGLQAIPMSRVILGCVRVCVLGAPKTLRVFRKALHTIVRSTSSRPRTNSINLECLTLEWQDRAINLDCMALNGQAGPCYTNFECLALEWQDRLSCLGPTVQLDRGVGQESGPAPASDRANWSIGVGASCCVL